MPPKAATKNKKTDNTVKAPKAGPDYSVKKITALVDGDNGETVVAPNPPRTRSVSREDLVRNLTTIQETPDEWFEIAHYAARNGTEDKPGGARKVVASFMSGAIATPDGDGEYDIDWRDATYDGGDRKGSVVIASFIAE